MCWTSYKTPASSESFQRNLNVVIRLSPPWGSSNYRDESDDADHLNYTTLARAFATVVSQLPIATGKNLYLQVALLMTWA